MVIIVAGSRVLGMPDMWLANIETVVPIVI